MMGSWSWTTYLSSASDVEAEEKTSESGEQEGEEYPFLSSVLVAVARGVEELAFTATTSRDWRFQR